MEGDAGEEGLRGALSAGAVDYLVEPVGAVELFARVGVALRIHRLIKRLRELSNRDGLTGLYDRRWAEGRMAVELERCARYRRSMSVAFVDLDGFAGICEEHGGHVGDLVLRQFADLARAQLRNPDVCARWGGGAGGGGEERFVVVFPETGALESSEALERMKRAAERLAWGVDGELQVTFSAGVAAPASRASGVTELLGEAERALHAARAAGKGRIFRAGEIPAPRLELITS